MRSTRSFVCILIWLVFFTACGPSYPKECNCSKFKTGHFIYQAARGYTYFIERNDSVQIEVNAKDPDDYTKLSIKWKDSCNYEALMLESTLPVSDSLQHVRKTIPFRIRIISTTPNFYIFRAQRAMGRIVTDTVWVDRKK